MEKPEAVSHGRRAALMSMLGAVAATACGGGGGAAPTAAPTPAPPPPVARLTLSGATMLAPNSRTLLLRGINEGTWGKMRSSDAAAIAAQGGNVVRVLIRWWGLYGGTDVESRADTAPGHFKPDHLAQFLTEIQWCIDAGLWVVPVIDSNCGQSGIQNAATAQYCDPSGSYPGGRNFWTDLTQRQLFKESWIYLAGILKDKPNIAFYELLPEPLSGRDVSYGDDVSAFYQELMAAIDETAGDKRTPFLVGARDAYNINLCDEAYIAAPRWANRVVYTGNLFIHTGKTQAENIADLESRLGALVAMRSKRNVPVFIQQFGVRSGDDPAGFYLDAGLSRMTAAGVGYTGWQWRQNTSSPDEYAVVVEDPNTGADIVKTTVLATYSTYWRALS
ncbi:MAG: cellulase family glycosylhydrolase [Pseudomonadota bacterium]